MPSRCVAASCGNGPMKGAVSLQRWPTDGAAASVWRHFVDTKRSQWKPSRESTLCSVHFELSCFTNYTEFTLGNARRLLLKAGAVPTIHAQYTTTNTLDTLHTACTSYSAYTTSVKTSITSTHTTLTPSTTSPIASPMPAFSNRTSSTSHVRTLTITLSVDTSLRLCLRLSLRVGELPSYSQ